MTRCAIKFWLPVIVLIFSPGVACADAGTPLLWASACHLLIGNAIIGVAEGLVLAFVFQQKRAPCVGMMIAANYFSAWAGGVFLIPAISTSRSLDLYNTRQWLWCMVAVSYFVTLLLEWPFVALCLRRSKGWFRKSIAGSLAVQSASYLVLFGWYWAASGISLYKDLAVVELSQVSLPKDTMLYYIAENGRDVYAQNLGQESTKIGNLKPSESGDRLFLQASRTAPGCWDLMVGSGIEYPSPRHRVLCAGLTCAAADPPWGSIRPGGDVPKFRADQSGWEFYFGWMAGNLSGRNVKGGQKLLVSLETPFVRWPVYSPTQLPSGQVVFQLGKNQICIVDPNARKIALVTKGRWPVVTMNDSRK